jgi:uncharacterized membrane-anchored protein YitT (DUF2179 family)
MKRNVPTESTPTGAVPHSLLENLVGLATGVFLASLGVFLIHSAHAVTGGTAGLSLLLSYATGVPFEWLFIIVNLPFFALAVWKKGVRFTVTSLACVAAVSALTPLHGEVLHLTDFNRVYGVAVGNLLTGIGLLILFRHGSSLGGFNIVALLAQERLRLRAGYVQMFLDLCVVVGALFAVDVTAMALSALGVVVLNIVLAFNHRPGRYMGF